MRIGSFLAIVLFTAVSLAHLYRLAAGVDVTINATEVPQWVSILGAVIPALVAWLLWRENRS